MKIGHARERPITMMILFDTLIHALPCMHLCFRVKSQGYFNKFVEVRPRSVLYSPPSTSVFFICIRIVAGEFLPWSSPN